MLLVVFFISYSPSIFDQCVFWVLVLSEQVASKCSCFVHSLTCFSELPHNNTDLPMCLV